jgi:excisionase family DNA binding protein
MSDLIDKFDSLDRALTVAEVAELLAVPKGTVYRKAKAGVLPSFHFGTLLRFNAGAIADWLRSVEKKPGQNPPAILPTSR